MYAHEILKNLFDGYKLRHKSWAKNEFICYENNNIYLCKSFLSKADREYFQIWEFLSGYGSNISINYAMEIVEPTVQNEAIGLIAEWKEYCESYLGFSNPQVLQGVLQSIYESFENFLKKASEE